MLYFYWLNKWNLDKHKTSTTFEWYCKDNREFLFSWFSTSFKHFVEHMLSFFFVCFLNWTQCGKKNHLSPSHTSLFPIDIMSLSLSLFLWHWWTIINLGNRDCLTSARMSSPAESSCCFTFPLSHLPTHITTLLYCPSRCFSVFLYVVCVCICVSHSLTVTLLIFTTLPMRLTQDCLVRWQGSVGLQHLNNIFTYTHAHTHPPHITHTYIHTHTLIVVCAPITYLC